MVSFLIFSIFFLILLIIIAWIKNIKWLGVIGGILTFLLTPLYIDFLGVGKFVTNQSSGEWAGFLGSYLGGGIGAFITLGGVWWQLNEEKKKEKIENLKKEGYAVVTFLILFRESCENYFYILKNSNNSNNIDFKVKNELFYEAIQDTEIVIRNKCIELLYFFDKFSNRNKVMSEIYNNYHDMLKELFYTLYEKTDTILGNYEIIKNTDNNYLENIYYNYLESDLNSLFTDVDNVIEKYIKQKD